ncbi:MAG TPA: hypothetical protein VGN37_16755 [Actinocatenispora sp.]
MNGPRVALAAGSLACLVAAETVAVAYGPAGARPLLVICAVLAVGLAGYAVVRRDGRIGAALVVALPALLVADPAWLVGPLGVLLLAAGELCAWSWEQPGADGSPALPVRRLARSGALCGAGLVASLLCYAVGRWHPWAGTAALFAAALGTAAIAWLLARTAARR